MDILYRRQYAEAAGLLQTDNVGAVNWERTLHYDIQAAHSVVGAHRELARQFGLETPYFEFTEKSEELLFDTELPGDVRLAAGKVGAFTTAQVGSMLHEQTVNYLVGKTMGREFPMQDSEALARLYSIMINGFDKDRLIVLFEQQSEQGANPVAGVQAFFGNSDNLIRDVIVSNPGNNTETNCPASTLTTFQALKIKDPTAEPSADFLAHFGGLTEREAVVMSRLYRQDKQVADALGVNTRDYAWIAMATLGVGLARLSDREDRLSPKVLIYDTHTRSIQSKLEEYFGVSLITQEGQTVPTDEVMNSVLRYHYGPDSQGGYHAEIITGFAEFTQYVERSAQYLSAKGISLNSVE